MTTGEAARLPAPDRVRVVVVEATGATCGIAVGDCFEVDGSLLRLPDDEPFCPHALAAAFPVLARRQSELGHDDWLVRKPYVRCARGDENVVLRLDAVTAADATRGDRT